MNCSWVVVIDKDVDKVLILKRSKNVRNPKQWCFPGGSSKKKNPKTLAKHELLEEVGIEYKKKDMGKIVEMELNKKSYHYFVVFGKTGLKVRLDKESSKFKWVKLKSLEHHKDQHQSIRKFVKYINDNKYQFLKML